MRSVIFGSALSRLIFSFVFAIVFIPDLNEIHTRERVREMAGGRIAALAGGILEGRVEGNLASYLWQELVYRRIKQDLRISFLH
jgi:hypothetical protein